MDLEDLIDAMDLAEEWGEANLDYDKCQDERIARSNTRDRKIHDAYPTRF